MVNIILYLLTVIQEQFKTICWLLNFICRYILLKQWTFDDSHSPKYQNFTTDQLPVIKTFVKQDWQFSSRILSLEVWQNLSGSFSGAMGNPSPMTRSALSVALHITISMITMTATDSTNEKSADRPSLPGKF